MSKNRLKTILSTVGLISSMLFGFTSLRAQTYEIILYNPTAEFRDIKGEGLGGQQRVGSGRLTGQTIPENTHALLWIGNSTTPIDLHPVGTRFNFSAAFDTDGTRQVGYVEFKVFIDLISGERQAALWNGTANSFVLLGPVFSEALSIAGDQQVGYIDNSFTCSECGPIRDIRATLWRGTAQSKVDLHPTGIGCDESQAFDTDGTNQVGYGYFPNTPRPIRALLWSGTRQSVVDLSSSSFGYSYAQGVKNGVQVGFGQNYSGGIFTLPTALLWRGTAASVRNLGNGIINDTNGTMHVGQRGNGAFRWDGDTGAGVDLHALLPAGFMNSTAEEIDEDGNIIGRAQRNDFIVVGVLWRRTDVTPTPTPSDSYAGRTEL